jgi:hypothetical protein
MGLDAVRGSHARVRSLSRRAILRAAVGAATLLLSRLGFAQKKPSRLYRVGVLFPGSQNATPT